MHSTKRKPATVAHGSSTKGQTRRIAKDQEGEELQNNKGHHPAWKAQVLKGHPQRTAQHPAEEGDGCKYDGTTEREASIGVQSLGWGRDNMADLLKQMGKLLINNPEYRHGYTIIQAWFLHIVATLRPPGTVATTYRQGAGGYGSNTGCFYCTCNGCRMASCPALREHLESGLVKPDPTNPKFVIYKDGLQLYPLPVGGQAGDAEHHLRVEQQHEPGGPVQQTSMIWVETTASAGSNSNVYTQEVEGASIWNPEDESEKGEHTDIEEIMRCALEVVCSKGATRSGKPYEQGGSRRQDKGGTQGVMSNQGESTDAPSPHQSLGDEPMPDAEGKCSQATPQYRYTSKAETGHSDNTYLKKVLNLPLSSPQSSIQLRDLIGLSLPLQKGLIEYL
ncbi:hypothetical protein OPQ81_004909 [Rhizoctonia solani]|nr:hypothetical protein OPQ81_004909 [Rhizoctonia solani]